MRVKTLNNQPAFGQYQVLRETFKQLPANEQPIIEKLASQTESAIRRKTKGIEVTLWAQKHRPQLTLTMKKGDKILNVSPITPTITDKEQLKTFALKQIKDFRFFHIDLHKAPSFWSLFCREMSDTWQKLKYGW